MFCVDYAYDFSSFNMPGILAYIVGLHPDSGDSIEIYYFETATDAENAYGTIDKFLDDHREECELNGEECNLTITMYDNMIWIGTEETIRDVSASAES
jgi:hypothetical protein